MQRSLAMLATITLATACSAMAVAQNSLPAPAASTATSRSAPPTRQVNRPGDRTCLRETGSLIRAKPGHCLPVPGRSYSGEELQRTGAPDTARALQMLDPSISRGR